MDILQVVLVVSLVLLTTLLVFLGVQVYFILQEVRVLLKSVERTMNNAAEISDMMKHPVVALTQIKGWGSVVTGLREGVKLYKSFRNKSQD